jgi:Na+/melibiose symporter-like transporter
MVAQVDIFQQGRLYGSEIIWTYGPLGFLLYPLALTPPEWFGELLLIRFSLVLIFVFLVFHRLNRFRGVRIHYYILLVLLVVFTIVNHEVRYSAFFLSFGLLCALNYGDTARDSRC